MDIQKINDKLSKNIFVKKDKYSRKHRITEERSSCLRTNI